VHIRRALLRVPSLCIHLQSADERASFAPNKEVHLQPILGLVAKALNEPSDSAPHTDRHAPELLRLLSAELGCEISEIMDFELSLCDTQPSSLWGLSSEFLSAPRLDNQVRH
jgi:aspartyl aminopeptidase